MSTAMAARSRTFEEILGETCLKSILLKVEETMMRVNSYSSGHQVDMMHDDIIRNARKYVNADPRLGRIMAAAFCEAVTVYCINYDKHGNVTAEIIERDAVYDDVKNVDAGVSRFPLEICYEKEPERLVDVVKLPQTYYLDVSGLVCG